MEQMEQTKQIKQREQVQVTKINDSTYRFTENAFGADVYMYLLLGKEKALLIDTGYGFTDIPSAIKEITDLPLTIVNTHGHLDHIHGNHMYEKVYLSKKDEEVFRRHTDYQEVKELMLSIARSNHIPEEAVFDPAMNLEGISTAYPSVHVPLPEEMYFELGERRVTVIETPGIRRDRSVFWTKNINGFL